MTLFTPIHTWRLLAYIKLLRPVFLLGGITLYGLGTAIAHAQGAVLKLDHVLLGQLTVTAIQLMAQCANEYFDIEGDRLNAQGRTWFSGGSGVLPGGQIRLESARIILYSCAALALSFVILISMQGPLIGGMAALALLGSWFYSAPPLALMKRGWGEISTSLIVALLVPLTGYSAQTGRVDWLVVLICQPLILLHWAMLIAFELPDYEADLAIGKRTQTVRLGLPRTLWLHTLLLLAAGLEMIGLIWFLPGYAGYGLLALPLLLWQACHYLALSRRVTTMATHNARGMNVLTMGAVGLFACSAALYLAGFIAPLTIFKLVRIP